MRHALNKAGAKHAIQSKASLNPGSNGHVVETGLSQWLRENKEMLHGAGTPAFTHLEAGLQPTRRKDCPCCLVHAG
ncbi:MAG: hypothetical protein ACO1TE_14755 [Prosthecobacter sp.]